MIRIYYVNTKEDNTIIDCISYPYLNYHRIETELDGEVLLRGYYKLINGELVKDEIKETEWLEEEQRIIAEMIAKENENHQEE
jgi:hypothetical protein